MGSSWWRVVPLPTTLTTGRPLPIATVTSGPTLTTGVLPLPIATSGPTSTTGVLPLPRPIAATTLTLQTRGP